MSQWAEEEFGAAQLGDQRRTRRLVAIATARAQRPSVSLPQSFDGKAGLKAMYQFCDSEHVRRDAILESHYQATARRVASEQIVLAVQDTTLYLDSDLTIMRQNPRLIIGPETGQDVPDLRPLSLLRRSSPGVLASLSVRTVSEVRPGRHPGCIRLNLVSSAG
ncbi:MAG: transposase [Candidatus Competibacteraceae bacterium]